MIKEKQKRLFFRFTKEDSKALLSVAGENPRKRAKKEMGDPREDTCIILNAVLPDSYICPHKHEHENSPAPDTLVAEKGLFKVLFFDDEGVGTDTVSVSKGDSPQTVKVVEIPADTWHTVVAITPCVFFEVKRRFEKREIFPSWAPKEETPEGKVYLEKLRKVVDKEGSQG